VSTDPKKNLPAKVEDPAAALAKLVEEFGPAALEKLNEIAKAFKLAEGVKKVRAVVKGAIDQILPLQGTALGFRTDKDKDGGYPVDVVVDCATEALLRGLRLTGNEWNIIGGKYYAAQAGCARLVAELPGLTDLEHAPGIPVLKEGGAIVEYTLSWKLDGKPMALTRKIPVRVNNGMGVDAILGKAKRKILAAAYERVTGSVLSDGDTEDPPMGPPAPSKPSQLAERIGANRPPQKEPEKDVETDEFGIPIFPQEGGGSLFGNSGAKLPD
jgi:hypothetical protein